MKTILCVCQLQIANMVAIKLNHPTLIYAALISRTVGFLNARDRDESVSLIVLIVEKMRKKHVCFSKISFCLLEWPHLIRRIVYQSDSVTWNTMSLTSLILPQTNKAIERAVVLKLSVSQILVSLLNCSRETSLW